MKISPLLAMFCLLLPAAVLAQGPGPRPARQHVPLDSIRLSDPFILADKKTHLYYLTGTGGLLWKSPDLKFWDGPYPVAQPNPTSWMGPQPMIWAAELHCYQGVSHLTGPPHAYYSLLNQHKCLRSQSRRDGCLDNAQAKSLWPRLKTEELKPCEWPVFRDLTDA